MNTQVRQGETLLPLAAWAASGKMLGPDDYDRIKGWRIYEVTCDDPGLSTPAYLAAKSAEAEARIVAAREAAMTNVQGIAHDTAQAIVQKLTGKAATAAELASARG